ncbi:MAG: S4 domain-containing protein YaaA [Anaerotignum sp.]|nr:S4 domain-containing protein YaaA [Anaerotignum sp.]
MEKITIHTEFIKLQQALKLAGLIDQGSDVKVYLAEGMVFVNGETATQRGKKIYPGDVIEVKGMGSVEVLAEQEDL